MPATDEIVLSSGSATAETVDPAEALRVCSGCGLTEAEFHRTGLLGCARCYERFAPIIAQAVERLHGVVLPRSFFESAPARRAITKPLADTTRRSFVACEFIVVSRETFSRRLSPWYGTIDRRAPSRSSNNRRPCRSAIESLRRAPSPMSAIIWAVVNQKGGVGKTTTAVNIAAYLAQGRRVLLVDTDPQGNATSGCGIDRRTVLSDSYTVLVQGHTIREARKATTVPGLDLVPATINLAGAEIEMLERPEREYILKNAIADVADDYDFVVIDSPPSLGLITVNNLIAAQQVLIPLQCEYYALEGITSSWRSSSASDCISIRISRSARSSSRFSMAEPIWRIR